MMVLSRAIGASVSAWAAQAISAASRPRLLRRGREVECFLAYGIACSSSAWGGLRTLRATLGPLAVLFLCLIGAPRIRMPSWVGAGWTRMLVLDVDAIKNNSLYDVFFGWCRYCMLGIERRRL